MHHLGSARPGTPRRVAGGALGQQFRFFREEVLAVLLNRPAGPDAGQVE
jgi:hypothetical protein